MNNYDEIKLMVEASRKALFRNNTNEVNQIKFSQGILKEEEEEKFEVENLDEKKETRTFKIQGALIKIHGDKKSELQLTMDEKMAFKESMEEFRNEISEIVDFEPLDVYENKVEWSGRIPNKEITFHFATDETNGVYIDAEMLKIDNEILELIEKLQKYFEKFQIKWSKILGSRKETEK